MKPFDEKLDRFGMPIISEQKAMYSADVELDVFSLPKNVRADTYTPTQKVKVEFDILTETRSWGIKSLAPVAPDQTVTIKIEMPGEEEDEEENIDVQIKNVKCLIERSEKESESISLTPSTLVMDIQREEFNLIFKV